MRRRRELIAVLALASAACTADVFTPQAADGGASDAASDGTAADGAAAGPRVSCGPSTCKLVETCCVYVSTNNTQYDCRAVCPQPQNSDQLSALKCSTTADCASGQVCCVQRAGAQNVSVCSATGCTSSQAQLCDPLAPASGCPSGASCSSNNIGDWRLPGAFGTCGGVPVP